MADTQETKKGVHTGVAVAAGAIIGVAGVAVAAALAHEPTRKKMGKRFQDAKIKVGSTVKDLQKSSKPLIKKAQDKMKELTETKQSEKTTSILDEELPYSGNRQTYPHRHGETRE